MKTSYLLLFTLLFILACSPGTDKKGSSNVTEQKNSESETWLQLFNGKDMEGWTIKMNKHEITENFNNTFRVENGLMITRYDQYDKFDGEYGHI